MIVVRFTSGLGNQMFQYNLYSSLKERFPRTQVLADLSWFDRFSEHQGYELERIFSGNGVFEIEKATDSQILRTLGRIPNHIPGRAGDVWQFILRIPHRLIRLFDRRERIRIEQTGFEDNVEILRQIEDIDPSKDHYITGFFIEEAYFAHRIGFLRRVFEFDDNLSPANREYAAEISSGYSVSIHVRRGDYLAPEYADSFLSLGEEYYKKAVELVKSEHPEARFFIFSDDKDFIRQAFSWLDHKVIVEGNTGRDSFRDMQLMSLCRSNIIANSTFSVWAGILNKNSNARVYYPSAYMKQKDTQEMTIPGWVRI